MLEIIIYDYSRQILVIEKERKLTILKTIF